MGFPVSDAYLTVLREAFDSAGHGPSLELYFGATSGDVFGSGDAGAQLGAGRSASPARPFGPHRLSERWAPGVARTPPTPAPMDG